MSERSRKRDSDLFAVDNHNETRPAHRVAGGVMFDTPSDAPPIARARGRGRAVGESRGPTAKPQRSSTKKRSPLVRQMLDHISSKGSVTRD